MGSVTLCAAPGCAVALSPVNRSGVCRRHTHGDWCRCQGCNARAGLVAPVPVPAPGVRQVLRPYTATNSGTTRYALISLPREPWEAAP